jgi:hypothetical protein
MTTLNTTFLPLAGADSIPGINANRALAGVALNGGKISLGVLGDSIVERFWPNDNAILSLVASGGVARCTTTSAHGLWPGLKIGVRGGSDPRFNGIKTVTSTPTGSVFTYSIDPNVSGSAGASAYYTSSNRLSANNSFLSYVQMLTNFQFDILNAGVSGERTDQVLARISEITGAGVSDCLVLCGINDCTQNVSASTIKANLATIYSTLRDAGIRVHARTLVGFGASAGATTAQISVMNQVNDYIRRWDGVPGVYVADYHAALIDPSSATGLTLAANLEAANTVHPSPAGCYLMATADKNAFLDIFPRQPNRLPTNQADTFNVSGVINQAFDNPTFQGTVLATGWSSSIGACTTTDTCVARTVVADGDICGNNQSRAYVNASGVAQTANFFQAPAAARFSAGDVIVMEADVQLTGVTTAMDGLRLLLNFPVNGITYSTECGVNKILTSLTANDLRARMQTTPMIVPAGTIGTVQAFVSTRFNNNATPTLLVGRAALRKIA